MNEFEQESQHNSTEHSTEQGDHLSL